MTEGEERALKLAVGFVIINAAIVYLTPRWVSLTVGLVMLVGVGIYVWREFRE